VTQAGRRRREKKRTRRGEKRWRCGGVEVWR